MLRGRLYFLHECLSNLPFFKITFHCNLDSRNSPARKGLHRNISFLIFIYAKNWTPTVKAFSSYSFTTLIFSNPRFSRSMLNFSKGFLFTFNALSSIGCISVWTSIYSEIYRWYNVLIIVRMFSGLTFITIIIEEKIRKIEICVQ